MEPTSQSGVGGQWHNHIARRGLVDLSGGGVSRSGGRSAATTMLAGEETIVFFALEFQSTMDVRQGRRILVGQAAGPAQMAMSGFVCRADIREAPPRRHSKCVR